METFVKDSMRNRRPTDGLTERIDVLGVGVAGGGRRGRRRRRRSGTGGRGGDDDHGQPPVALIGSGHRRHRRRPSGDVDVRPRQEDGLADQQHDEGDADAPAPVIGQPEARPAPVTQRRHLLDRRSSLVSFFFLADPRKTLEHTHNSARKRCVSLFRSLSLFRCGSSQRHLATDRERRPVASTARTALDGRRRAASPFHQARPPPPPPPPPTEKKSRSRFILFFFLLFCLPLGVHHPPPQDRWVVTPVRR